MNYGPGRNSVHFSVEFSNKSYSLRSQGISQSVDQFS